MRDKPLQVLLVEDSAGDARLIREMFCNENAGSFEFTHLLRISEAEAHLAKARADIILLDMGLPDAHGIETVRRVHAVAPGIPLIVLTGLDDEVLAAEAMKEGAQDYLIKGQIESRALPRALRHAIDRHQMQIQTDLIRTHQLEFKDEFLSHVSHELRSPLTAIYQFVTILLDGLAGELKAEQHDDLQIVLRNVKQLQAMINDLVEVTRVQAGKLVVEMQCTSVKDAIHFAMETLQGAASAKGVTLSADSQDLLPSVYADPTRIRQVLLILVDNAIKFTPTGGTVKIQGRKLEDTNSVVVEVVDSGIGIDPEMTERVFERLVQASDPGLAGRKGLGLGLYIAKELITRQGGNIWAKNALGHGAIVSFALPVFSLKNLIARSLREERRTEASITLVVTEIGSKTGWLSDELRVEQSQKIRELLQGCLHSDLDVLLPKMSSAGAVELYFIVAATGVIGGDAITKRIRERLDNCGYLQQAGLTLATSYQVLHEVKRNMSGSMEEFQASVAQQLQERMNQEISSRMVMNG